MFCFTHIQVLEVVKKQEAETISKKYKINYFRSISGSEQYSWKNIKQTIIFTTKMYKNAGASSQAKDL